MSVKLCNWFEIGNHGAWGCSRPTKREFGDVQVAVNGVVAGQVHVRDARVLERGRIRVLRAPNPISLFLFSGSNGC